MEHLLSPLEDMLVLELSVDMLDEVTSFDSECYDILLGIE